MQTYMSSRTKKLYLKNKLVRSSKRVENKKTQRTIKKELSKIKGNIETWALEDGPPRNSERTIKRKFIKGYFRAGGGRISIPTNGHTRHNK